MQIRDSALKLAIKNCFLPINRSVVVVEPHLGLGDNLICLGLMRELSNRYPDRKFYYACLRRCYHSLAWMFQDLNNIFLFAVSGGREARQLAGFLNASYMPIGIEKVDIKGFDKFFYQQHCVDFDLRWSNCATLPGPNSDALFETLNPAHKPYILICRRESGLVTYDLNINYPENHMIIYVEPLTNNIFDWTKLAIEAKEIHTIDTSFVHFVESLFYQKSTPPLYYHLARQSPTEFERRLPWNYVKY